MDEQAKNGLIDQFVSIAGVEDKNRATFYLESANWNVELAIQSFFDNSEPIEAEIEEPEMPNQETNQPEPGSPARKSAPPAAAAAGRSGASSNIATFSSIRNESEPDPGQQAFYAGGSEHSGQQVLGPQARRDPEQIVKDMFKQARENAKQIDAKEKDKKGSASFAGSGFTLGSTTNDSIRIGGMNQFLNKDASDNDDDEEDETVLKLWRNGFSVDDGPLLNYDDPKNQQFLAAIRRGEVPAELAKGRRRDVSLRMEDHRHEEFIKPKVKVSAFACEGHRLGNPTSDVVSAPVPSAAAAAASADPEKSLEQANAFLALNQSEPNTRIQIRLADGSRLVAHINTSRLVSDLRQYISLARPEYSATPFDLMTTFPNKIIDNESATIAASGLANSAILQRLSKT